MVSKKIYILSAILILGMGVRLFSINYGLPYVVGPDETRQILDAFGMASRLSLMPQDFAYAALHKYILLFVYALYFTFGKIMGIFSDKLNFAFKFLTDPYAFYLIARVLSAGLGTITVFVVYKIGEKLYNYKVGLVAAIFAAVNFHLVQLSYWVSADILLVFFASLTFFFIFKLLKEDGFGNIVAASLLCGLAISSKFQGIMLIVPLGAGLLLKFWRDRRLLKISLISLVILVLSSLIGNAQYLLKSQEALKKFMEILHASQFGISSATVFRHNFFDSTTWYFKELIRQDGMLGLLFCLAFAYALFRVKLRENLIFILFLFTFLVFFSRSSLRYVYYGGLALPVFCVFAAKFINDMYINSWLRKSFVAVFTAVIFIFSLIDVLHASSLRSHPDTRQLAKSWIEEHVPAGTEIAIDWYELSVPLQSDIPFMMRTGNAIEFYNAYVPGQLRSGFSDYVRNSGKFYNLIPVIHRKEKDFWPIDMPQDILNDPGRRKFAERLYSYFNFLNLEELRKRNAKYLVISSYSYSHFLLDSDPEKTELFNPYISENTLINNRQAQEYEPDTKESALYFLSRRARDFYSPILNSKAKGVLLLKEFKPTKENLGPVIKIYKLELISQRVK